MASFRTLRTGLETRLATITGLRTYDYAMDASLTDRFVFEHCGEPMAWAGGKTSWVGKPGEGSESVSTYYGCACGAKATVTLTEPC